MHSGQDVRGNSGNGHIGDESIGGGVVALCGKVWVPKHDPSKYPVCPDCKRIYEEMTR